MSQFGLTLNTCSRYILINGIFVEKFCENYFVFIMFPSFSPGVTTVLTMTFLGLEARTDLPQVAYPTALDYFVFISFMFIFATVVQVRTPFIFHPQGSYCPHKSALHWEQWARVGGDWTSRGYNLLPLTQLEDGFSYLLLSMLKPGPCQWNWAVASASATFACP